MQLSLVGLGRCQTALEVADFVGHRLAFALVAADRLLLQHEGRLRTGQAAVDTSLV